MLPHFVACCDKSCRTICWLPRLPSLICHATLCAHLKLSGKKYGTTFYLLWSIFCVLTHTHAHWPALGAGADFLYCCCCCCHVVVAVVVICLDFLLFICCIKQNKSNLIYSCTTHTHTHTRTPEIHTHTQAHHVGVVGNWQYQSTLLLLLSPRGTPLCRTSTRLTSLGFDSIRI